MIWQLFWSFLKIGAFTFGGGYAMIPLIAREMVDRRKWLEKEEFLGQLTLAQTAPGPLALNTAVFVGYKVSGWRGSVVAAVGVAIPSFFIILLIAIFFADFRDNPTVEAAFKGVRPGVVALILTPIFGLAKGIAWWKLGLAALAALVVSLLGLSPVYLLLIGAIGGIVYALYNPEKGRKVEEK